MVPRRKAIAGDPLNLLLFPAASLHGEIESDAGWREVPAPPWPAAAVVPPFAAVDFETYYDQKYSLTTMHSWEYVAHSAFVATLVAVEWFDGKVWRRWVGRPADAPWSDLAGIEWWSHEAVFDELVARRLRRDGLVLPIPENWNCTSDLAGYFQLDRGLAACAPRLIGETVDKTVRQKMKGGMAGGQEQKDYAGTDARQCAWIRHAHAHRWPELERYLSRLMRRAGYRGIFADQELMGRAKVAMIALMRKIEKELPWCNRYSPTGATGINHECDKLGIPRPYSLSLDDLETTHWQTRYDKWGWLEKIRDYTKAKQNLAHIDMMIERTRKDGTVPFELIYRKAPHTARWQSGSGLRIQNLDKEAFNGFHVRHYISCRPGTKLISCDSTQIEPRVQNWSVGDKVFLEACRGGASPYEAHARATMGWTGGDLKKLSKSGDPQGVALYALAKARVLALGYQAAAPRYEEMARTMAGLTVYQTERSFSPDMKTFYRESQIRDRLARGECEDWLIFPDAVSTVRDYRRNSKLIVDDWYATEDEMRRHVGGDWVVPLPNGEVIYYYDVREEPGGEYGPQLTAWVVKESKNPKNHKHFHGGKLVENRIQRIAREVLAHFKHEIDRKLRKYKLFIEWSTHDEVNADCPASEAAAMLEAMLEIMHTPPPWALDLPVAAEGSILTRYEK